MDSWEPRILHVITGLSTGGAEWTLYNVLSGGLASHHKTAVISLRNTGTLDQRIEELEVPVYALGISGGIPGPDALWRLWRVIQDFRPDVIQGWMYHGNLAASVAARMARDRPAVAWNVRHSLYGLDDEKVLTRQVIRASRRFSAGVHAVVYNSRVSQEQHEAFGFDGRRAQVIPNGFDVAGLRPDTTVAMRVRREFGIPDAAPLVGHVARFHPIKNHASFLRVALKVAEALPDARFLVVGREVSPDNPALAGIVPPGLLDRFRFPGERSDVPELMQAMDLLCQSSWSEAFPNVLGEAMACGVPCVATDVGASSLIIGETGCVVEPGDDEALLNALMSMLNKATEERRSLGQAARNRIEVNFGLATMIDRYTELYHKLRTQARPS